MDNMAESSRLVTPGRLDFDSPHLNLSVDIGSDGTETDELVVQTATATCTTPAGKKAAAATAALPQGLTMAHFMCEAIYLVVFLFLLNIEQFIDEWLSKNGKQYNVSDQRMGTWDKFQTALHAYVIINGVGVLGAMVASISRCRKLCGGYKGDRCGTTIYLITSILGSFLSVIEVAALVFLHVNIKHKECDNLYLDIIPEVTKWEFVQNLVLMFTVVTLIKLVLRLGAMAGASQRLCCPNIADSMPSSVECLQSSRAHKKKAGCFACAFMTLVVLLLTGGISLLFLKAQCIQPCYTDEHMLSDGDANDCHRCRSAFEELHACSTICPSAALDALQDNCPWYFFAKMKDGDADGLPDETWAKLVENSTSVLNVDAHRCGCPKIDLD